MICLISDCAMNKLEHTWLALYIFSSGLCMLAVWWFPIQIPSYLLLPNVKCQFACTMNRLWTCMIKSVYYPPGLLVCCVGCLILQLDLWFFFLLLNVACQLGQWTLHFKYWICLHVDCHELYFDSFVKPSDALFRLDGTWHIMLNRCLPAMHCILLALVMLCLILAALLNTIICLNAW